MYTVLSLSHWTQQFQAMDEVRKSTESECIVHFTVAFALTLRRPANNALKSQ
jgi:hypothetical protein